MKKGIFSSWFREIATIIFTQTIQAFLLAIVMSIIISALGSQSGSTDQSGSSAAAGLLAIIALSQFGKIELLIKNIFGVTSGVADTSMNAGFRGLTAGKVIAARGLARMANNGRKIGEGIKSFKTRSEIKDLKSEKETLEAHRDAGLTGDPTTNRIMGSTTNDLDSSTTGSNANNALNVSAADIVAAIHDQTNAIKQQTDAQERNRQDDKIEKLEQKIQEASDKKKEQIRTGVSGLAETAGGLYGASAGLAVGLAQGDNIAETTMGGMGVGDYVGESVAKAGFGTIDSVKGINKISKSKGKRNLAIQQDIEKQTSDTEKALAQIDEEIAKATNQSVKNKLQQQHNNITTQYNNYLDNMKAGKTIGKTSSKVMQKKNISKKNIKYDIGKDQ